MNHYRILTAVLVIVLSAAVSFFLFVRHRPAPRPEITRIIRPLSPGDGAPSFSLPNVKGRMVSLGDYSGKVVIVNFWATSCVPCKEEIPDFITLQSRYGSRGLQVIGIGLDDPDNLKEYAEKSGMNYEVLLGTNEVAWLFGGISGIPRTFMIDKRGTIVSIYAGRRSGSLFEGEVRRLLE